MSTLNQEEMEAILTLNASYQTLVQRMLGAELRDIDTECKYPEVTSLSPEDYRRMYDKFGIAARVVDILPTECWQFNPEVYEVEDEDTETEFEKAWKDLNKNLNDDSWFVDEETSPVWETLYRGDCLSGIGRYGGILLGLSDEDDFEKPLPGFGEKDPNSYGYTTNAKKRLLYTRVFDESLIEISNYEASTTNRRYGQPTYYNITLSDPTISHTGIGHDSGKEVRVHWSRVIHLVDNLVSSEVFGMPRMQNVYPHLLDLRKLYGGSAEMFWKGAFFGISVETHQGLGSNVKIDATAMKEQFSKYFEGLQRYLSLTNAAAKPLSPQVSDPTNHIERTLDALCIRLGIPKRIFVGSERGELASSQDSDTWEDRLRSRRTRYIIPRVIRPFIDRLIRVGVLPVPQKGYHIKWVKKQEPNDIEKADTAKKRVEALSVYLSSGVEALMQPIDFLVKELGYDREEAQDMLESASEYMDEQEDEDMEKMKKQQEAMKNGQIQPPPQLPGSPPVLPSGNQPPKGANKKGGTPGSGMGEFQTNNKLTFNESACGAGGGKGRPGFQPGNTCAKGGGSGGFPASLSDLTFVSHLGGSTGAKLMKDSNGKQYVVKTGASSGHVANEFIADEIYRAAGVPVPKGKLYKDGDGNAVKVTEYGKSYKALGDLDGTSKASVIKEVQDNFVLDAVLANWDVVGSGQDNIMVDMDTGTAVRVDNGGSLLYRAQGALKGDKFTNSPNEIETMLNDTKNIGAHSVFSKMNDAKLKTSLEIFEESQAPAIKKLLDNPSPELKEALSHLPGNGKELVNTLLTRVSQATPKMNTVLASKKMGGLYDSLLESSTSSAVSASTSNLSTANSLVSHLKSKQFNMDTTLAKKITYVNPDGISDGVFYLPLVGSKVSSAENEANKTMLKEILPPGTKIKGFWVKGKEGSYSIPNKELATKIKNFVPKPSADPVQMPKPTPVEPPKPIKGNPGVTFKHQGQVMAQNKTLGAKITLESVDSKGMMVRDKHDSPGRQALKEYDDNLSSKERSALESWKGSGTEQMRKNLSKGGTALTSQEVALKSALDKAPRYEGVTYRGLSGNEFTDEFVSAIENAGIGGYWSENAPACTSRNPKTASSFTGANGIMLKIEMKSGAMIENISNYRSEAEVVSRPGVVYRIKGIHKDAEIEYPRLSDDKFGYYFPNTSGGTEKKTIKAIIELEEV